MAMPPLKFFKVASLPPSLVADAVYFVSSVLSPAAESWVTDSTGAAKQIGNTMMIQSLIAATFIEHVQSTASTVWTVNHTFGHRPVVECFTPGGIGMSGEIRHVGPTQFTVSFSSPISGYLIAQ